MSATSSTNRIDGQTSMTSSKSDDNVSDSPATNKATNESLPTKRIRPEMQLANAPGEGETHKRAKIIYGGNDNGADDMSPVNAVATRSGCGDNEATANVIAVRGKSDQQTESVASNELYTSEPSTSQATQPLVIDSSSSDRGRESGRGHNIEQVKRIMNEIYRYEVISSSHAVEFRSCSMPVSPIAYSPNAFVFSILCREAKKTTPFMASTLVH